MRTFLEEVCSSNLGPIKSNTVLPTDRHHCNVTRRRAPQIRYTLQRNTSNIMKDLMWFSVSWYKNMQNE